MRASRIFLSAILLGAATPALAADLPAEGLIDSNFTWTSRNTGTIPAANGNNRVTLDAMLVVTAAAPGSVLDRLGAHCIGGGKENPKTFAYEFSGACVFEDADGDQIFEIWEESMAAGAAESTGKGTLTDGTGKYAGISGEYTLTSSFYGSPADGVFQGIGHKKGTYKITK
jgi:hypothetical protein